MNVFGPKPIAIIIFVIMLTTTAVMTGYAVYAWSARQSYKDISEINDRQISSLQELLKLNDDLRKQKVELEQTIKRLEDVEDNVLVIRDEQSVELQN